MIDLAATCAFSFLANAVVSGIAGNQANMAVVASTRGALYAVRCFLNNLKKLDAKENHVLYRAMLTAHWQAIQQTAAAYARINHIELHANFGVLPPPLRKAFDSFHLRGELVTLDLRAALVTLRSGGEGDALKALVAECDQRITSLRIGPPEAPQEWAGALNSMFEDLTALMAQNRDATAGPAETAWRLLQAEFPAAAACDGYRELFVSRWYECLCVNFQVLTKTPDVAPLLTGKLFAEIREREEAPPFAPSTFVAALEGSIRVLLEGTEQRIVAAVGESEKRTTHAVQQVGSDLGLQIGVLTEQINAILRPGFHGASSGQGAVESGDEDAPQAAPAVVHNVPKLGNETIGRLAEVEKLSAMLLANRLVTIWGAGGSGKTRVAIEVARHLEPSFERGTLFVDLASLAPASGEDSLVPSRIATVAGVREQVKRPPTEILAEHFRQGNTLLILDNCEHLIRSCVNTAAYLITHCPDLTILATSRTRLSHPAERP
jgi:hypothetical protein